MFPTSISKDSIFSSVLFSSVLFSSVLKSEKELDFSLEENTSVIDLETDDVEMDTNEENLDDESGLGSNIDLLI